MRSDTSNLHFQWLDGRTPERFRTGISLHGHTLHSKESLDFFYQGAEHSSFVRFGLERGERRYEFLHDAPLDLRRGWWTPPLHPIDAWNVERNQLENTLGLRALVSLTDHDDIEAPLTLRAIEESGNVPVSVEWSVPFRGTTFHIGVHNVLGDTANETMAALREITHLPLETRIGEMLESLHANPEVLIVFNHPHWDERDAGPGVHSAALAGFLGLYKPWLHAVEINGLRPWSENQKVLELAKAQSIPLVSGGDRHALEPNATLNLSNAASFSEFVEEVRNGVSEMLVMPQFRKPHWMRMALNIRDVIKSHPHHRLGWTVWTDRVFYRCEDNVARSLTELWGQRRPSAVGRLIEALQMIGSPLPRRLSA